MRIVKEHDERKNEIISTATRLFVQKGYSQCSVNDILKEIGIAKGTFYHYFKSKEEVLDAVIGKATDLIAERVEQVVENTKLSPVEKLFQIFLSIRIEDQMEDGLLEEMHKHENALMHQKELISCVEVITPALTQIVEEGIEQGIFQCQYPEQYMRIFLTSILTLMDDGIFQVEPEQQQLQFMALISLLEEMLSVPKDSFMDKVKASWKM